MIWFKIDENLTPVPCKNADEWSESFAQRYRTYSEAVEGHRKLVQERTP